MEESSQKRIFAGYYRRYDNRIIYVISTAKDAETGEETVVFTDRYSDHYYTTTAREFCESVEVNGESLLKYVRQCALSINDTMIDNLELDGFRGPKRHIPVHPQDEYEKRNYQAATSYALYAKDLCENYLFDLRKYKLCVKEQRYISITKSDYKKLKEDLVFLRDSLDTVLKDYKDFFRERYVEGLSVRKYAAAHEMNRGNAAYLQKKFLAALARLLKERDEAEGVSRLKPPTTSEAPE